MEDDVMKKLGFLIVFFSLALVPISAMSAVQGDVDSNGALDVARGGTNATTAEAAFTNLKQQATTDASGAVELATEAETVTGTDAQRAVTPAGLTARLNEPSQVYLSASTISDLRALPAKTSGTLTFVAAHTTAGDGGGGMFRYVSGAAAGTYTDNNGTVIVPTGGNGSAAWVREYEGDIGVAFFGGKNTAAIQAAIDAAAAGIVMDGPYPTGMRQVILQAGSYTVASGETIRIPKGVRLVGAGRSAVTITHGGGNVPLFDTDPALTNNVEIVLSGMTLIGSGAGSTYGVKFNNSIRNAALEDMDIRSFNVNAYFNDCWTFRIDRCDLQSSVTHNIEWHNATAGSIKDSRIDNAGEHNVYITSSTTPHYTLNLNILSSQIQFAQKAGIYLEDVESANIFGGYFEGNNKSNGGFADIHSAAVVGNRGKMLGLYGCYGTSSGAGGSTSRFVHAELGHVTMSGCYNYSNPATPYQIGVEVGSSVLQLSLFGCRIQGTTRISRGTVPVVEMPDDGGRILFNESSPTEADGFVFAIPSTKTTGVFKGFSNAYWKFDAPANRRNEFLFGKWFIGRGDNDEQIPEDFYIARSSGGGSTPDFRIDSDTGDTIVQRKLSVLTMDVHADNAAAIAAGKTAGQLYRNTTGQLMIVY
jgi:hypothetical protein